MKEKIDNIFYDLKHELITERQAHQQVLNLFNRLLEQKAKKENKCNSGNK
jgi:hypothetical protein